MRNCARMRWFPQNCRLDKEDQCPEDLFNRILWRAMKGSQTPYPEWAVRIVDDD